MIQYISIDGNGIGKIIEASIIFNDVEHLSVVSRKISVVIKASEEFLIEKGANIHMSGGDNILASIKLTDDIVKSITDLSNNEIIDFSIGIGQSPRESYLALKAAKAKKATVLYYASIQ